MKFLLDENLSPRHVKAFRAEGHDALSVLEAGLAGAPDTAVRACAVAEGRTLVTLDADFANILRYPLTGIPGVIRLRLHPPTEKAIAQALRRVLAALEQLDLTGRLMVVDDHKIRIRG